MNAIRSINVVVHGSSSLDALDGNQFDNIGEELGHVDALCHVLDDGLHRLSRGSERLIIWLINGIRLELVVLLAKLQLLLAIARCAGKKIIDAKDKS